MYNYQEDMKNAKQKTVYLCSRCKGDDVAFEACVKWHFKRQKFVLIGPPHSLDRSLQEKNTGVCFMCDPDTNLGHEQEIDVATVWD
jgi:hypothetical protein